MQTKSNAANWQTTAVGILTAIGAIIPVAIGQLTGQDLANHDWLTIGAALYAAWKLIFGARDPQRPAAAT